VKATLDDRQTISPSTPQAPAALHALLLRIESEYREMPGMCVTAPRAQRLWGLDATTCAFVLTTLVERGFLRRTARGAYIKR
jgi:hypothetical protein